MLTGRVPFTGEGYGEVMLKHVNDAAALGVRGASRPCPRRSTRSSPRAMAKSPADRYQTMAELRVALLDLAGQCSRRRRS